MSRRAGVSPARTMLLRRFPSPPALLTRPLSSPPTPEEIGRAWAHVERPDRIAAAPEARARRRDMAPSRWAAALVAKLRRLA